MALWDRVRTELDRAGRVAQQAFDEGRLRLEMVRARRHADTAAQRLGYVIYRAKRESRELGTEEYASLARAIEHAEAAERTGGFGAKGAHYSDSSCPALCRASRLGGH